MQGTLYLRDLNEVMKADTIKSIQKKRPDIYALIMDEDFEGDVVIGTYYKSEDIETI